ncbi:hypothetical protein K432DRAFT_377901 [Lepidopterella palustris CBS 459.81]|uniref:Mediator of RNA polymerase II transcription subunit 8 n=1 Tax=Lepidopterella palustris CBS 459.81 TaxID=1314670 RepID=A0A8E2EJZ0_9PEZI|nr:hypothetical protein K432DRAFT_377901 [Lepidopterella palustris CBS 459.81]
MQAATNASSPEDIKALEQTRLRLQAVVKSLGQLQHDLAHHETLPSWPSLQKSSALLIRTISSLLSTTETHSKFLHSAHAYPLPTFPGRSQAGLLDFLLRKKHEPSVEDWIIEGLKAAAEFCDASEIEGMGVRVGERKEKRGLDEEDITELWEWAGPAENDIARRVLTAGEHTSDEEDDEDEEDDDEDADQNATKDTQMTGADVPGKQPAVPEPPPLPLATILRFMTTGSVPLFADPQRQNREQMAAIRAMSAQREGEAAAVRAGIATQGQ